MADSQIARPKRQGNYVPERLKLIEPEIAKRYAAGESAKSLAAEYGISKTGVQSAARRQGVAVRGKPEAAQLYRTVDPTLTPEELTDTRPIAQQVAERLGYGTSAGLSYDREFQTACTKEYRRRSCGRYREVDSRRKWFLNNIPAWTTRKQLQVFYDMAADLGLEVDHIIPLQGENVCGLNVPSNLQILHQSKNQSKQNKCRWISDPLIGPPRDLMNGGSNRGSRVRTLR